MTLVPTYLSTIAPLGVSEMVSPLYATQDYRLTGKAAFRLARSKQQVA